MRLRAPGHLLAAALWLALGACGTTGPRPLVPSEDACDVCRMAITDLRFGGEVVLGTGRHRTFDSIECLANWLATSPDTLRATGVYVSDYEHQALIPAAAAVFVRGGALRSPMGRELAAFAAGSPSAALQARYGGEVMDWAGARRVAFAGLGVERPGTPERP